MVDSGMTTTFINKGFVVENCVAMRKLYRPIPLYNIDGTLNRDGMIDVAILELQVGEHRGCVVFIVTDIRAKDVIIGLDWLCKHNPNADWDTRILRLPRCPESCRAH